MTKTIDNSAKLEVIVNRIQKLVLRTSGIVCDALFSEMIDKTLEDISQQNRDEFMQIAMRYGYATQAERNETARWEIDGCYSHCMTDSCPVGCYLDSSY